MGTKSRRGNGNRKKEESRRSFFEQRRGELKLRESAKKGWGLGGGFVVRTTRESPKVRLENGRGDPFSEERSEIHTINCMTGERKIIAHSL